MSPKPLPNFQSLVTHHCCSGSMQHIYTYNQHLMSEDLLLGIGGGVGFVYWHTKGTAPFIGGRGKGRPHDNFESCVGERTGVIVEDFTTTSAKKAEQTMMRILESGKPVMLQCDMGFLPYFNFGGNEYHFGAHFIVICGYDTKSRTVLVADRDKEFHSVSIDILAKARGSTFQPFPPKNRWFTFDFKDKRQPTPAEVRQAITEQVEGMLDPPITNFGVKGIRKAAKRSLKWQDVMDDDMLRFTMFNTYIFIDPEGGSGGGIFRYMFSRFLREAAQITGETRLIDCADQFWLIADRWQDAAVIFKQGWKAKNPADVLPETSTQMLEIADLEEAAWQKVSELI